MIAEEALLEGTIRTTHVKVRSQIMAGIERMEKAMGELYGATISVSFSAGYPAVTNDPAAAALAKEAARTVVGTDSVVAQAHPALGARTSPITWIRYQVASSAWGPPKRAARRFRHTARTSNSMKRSSLSGLHS